LNSNAVRLTAEQLEMVDAESHHFLNIKTGEFVSYSEYFPDDDIARRNLSRRIIMLPSQYDIHEYDIMRNLPMRWTIPANRNCCMSPLRERVHSGDSKTRCIV